MERKLGMGLMLMLGGLGWSCVTPAEVDEAGTEPEAQEAASTSSGSGAGPASSADGSGGTHAEATSGGATRGTSAGGTGAGEEHSTSGSHETSTGGSGADEESTGQSAGGAASTDDICPFDGELEYDPAAAYPFCNGTESFSLGVPVDPSESDPVQNRCRGEDPESQVGIGIATWTTADSSPDGEPVNYCLCLDACEVDTDCPEGDTGEAQPLCLPGNFGNNSCLLACDSGETCPDGMTCTQGNENGHRVCAWGTRGAACDTSEWPAVTP